VSAGLRRRFQHGDAALAYVQTQTTVLGHPGPVTVKGVRASLSHSLGGPFQVSAAPGYFRVIGSGSQGTVYRLATEVACTLFKDVVLSASHQFGLQQGGPTAARDEAMDIARNTFQLTLARRVSR
jgi:hypothetical protein